jgi:transposase
MFSLNSSLRFYLYQGVTDMRKSFDGLCGIVQSQLGRDPTSGEVFIFINRRRDRVKLLHWQNGGFVLYYKRLESGTFEFPSTGDNGLYYQLSWRGLVMMIEGISLKNIKQRKRYSYQQDFHKSPV